MGLRSCACGLLLAIALPFGGARGALITNVRALGDSAGVWDNSNASNWQIWFTRDPLSNPAPTFVNVPALNTPFALAFGDNQFVMYKQNHVYPNNDHGTTFSFSNGAATGSLTVTMSPTGYLTTTAIPGVVGASISLAGADFAVTSYGWMRRDVLSRNLVSAQSPVPGAPDDDIAVVNIRVGPVSVPTGGTGPGGLERADMTSSLLYWLDAGKGITLNGATVSAWADQTNRGNNFSNATVAEQPVFQASGLGGNSLPSLQFDGSNDYLILNTANYPRTVFAVTNVDTGGGLRGIWGSSNPGDKGIRLNSTTNYRGPGQSADGNDFPGTTVGNVRVNGAVTTAYTVGTPHILTEVRGSGFSVTTFNNTRIGGYYGGRYYHGDVGEIIVYDRVLNLAERQIVENYLSAKYGVPLATGDVYAGDNPGNGDYDLDVFGLGRVDGANLLMQAGAAGLGLQAANGTLDNGEWLLAGHKTPDNAALGRLWDRVWYVDKTGSLDANFVFDFSDSGRAAPSTLDALIYYSETNAFSFTPLLLSPTVDGDRLTFTVPDSLLRDGYYTLGLVPEPATLSLLALGGLALLRRRRRS